MSETTTKIISIALSALTNGEHVELMTKFKAILDQFGPMDLQVQMLYDKLTPLLIQEEQALVASRGNSKTKLLLAADKVRDDLHRGLCYAVKSYQFDTDSDNVESSTQLLRVINTYGLEIRRKPYNEETALVRSLVADLTNESNLPHLTKIGVEAWTTKLSQANQEFDELMSSRLEEDAASLSFTVRDIRLSIDPIYRDITQALETFATLGVTGPFAEAITQLNAVVAYYN